MPTDPTTSPDRDPDDPMDWVNDFTAAVEPLREYLQQRAVQDAPADRDADPR